MCSTGNKICRKPSSLAVLSWNVRGPPFRGLALTLRCSTAHDFFTAQPRHSADVFILRAILHDWSDAYALKILKHLRIAAKPETRLVILEQLILYACAQPTPEGIEGTSAGPPVPAPLLANMGYASLSGYLIDMQVRRVRPFLEACEIQTLADAGSFQRAGTDASSLRQFAYAMRMESRAHRADTSTLEAYHS